MANAQQTYCPSSSSGSTREWISRVKIGSIDNTSNGAQYQYFGSLATSHARGSVVPVSLTAGFSGGNYAERWAVFVDLNGDRRFTAPAERVFAGTTQGSSPLTGSFFIPPNSRVGPTLMRVSMQWGSVPPPCGTIGYGEVEDYTLRINVPESATPTVAPPTPTSVPATPITPPTITPAPPTPTAVPSSYCPASSTSVGAVYFKDVKIDRTELPANASTPYLDYTSTVIPVNRGGYVSVASHFITGQLSIDPAKIGAWIDFNRNFVFEQNEMVLVPLARTLSESPIILPQIPNSAVLGDTRLRLRIASASTDVSPCGVQADGQTIDLTVSIGSGNDATGFTGNPQDAQLSIPPGFIASESALLAGSEPGIVILGSWVDANAKTSCLGVIKTTVSGTLDRTFGTAGAVCLEPRAGSSPHSGMHLRTTEGGDIYISSSDDRNIKVRKLTSSGSVNQNYGSAGTAVIYGGGWSWPFHLIELSFDGSLLVIARELQNGVFVQKLKSDGTIDGGFGASGKLSIPYSEGYPSYLALAEALGTGSQPSRIIVAMSKGSSTGSISIQGFSIYGYADTNFGTRGIVTLSMPYGTVEAITPTSTGFLVSGKKYSPDRSNEVFTASYSQDGQLIGTYGTNGIAYVPAYTFYSVKALPGQTGLGLLTGANRKVRYQKLTNTGSLSGETFELKAHDIYAPTVLIPKTGSMNLRSVGNIGARPVITELP